MDNWGSEALRACLCPVRSNLQEQERDLISSDLRVLLFLHVLVGPVKSDRQLQFIEHRAVVYPVQRVERVDFLTTQRFPGRNTAG